MPREVPEQAWEDAVVAIVTADPTLSPARVLRALDWDGEHLSFGGRYADEVASRTSLETLYQAELLFKARLEDDDA